MRELNANEVEYVVGACAAYLETYGCNDYGTPCCNPLDFTMGDRPPDFYTISVSFITVSVDSYENIYVGFQISPPVMTISAGWMTDHVINGERTYICGVPSEQALSDLLTGWGGSAGAIVGVDAAIPSSVNINDNQAPMHAAVLITSPGAGFGYAWSFEAIRSSLASLLR